MLCKHSVAAQSLPGRADALRHERETLPASQARHGVTTGTRALRGVWFLRQTRGGKRNCTDGILDSPGKRGSPQTWGTIFGPLSDTGDHLWTPVTHSVCTAQLVLLPRTALSPGRRLLCHSGKNWDSGRSKMISPKGEVFLFLTPKVTGNLQITHPFPGTLAGKKIQGPCYFPTQTHTYKGALQRP